MKPGIQTNMELRINEIREQSDVFDKTITAIEDQLNVTMEASSPLVYTVQTDGWTITAGLDESLYDGVVTISVNKEIVGGSARFATMTVTSQRTVHENYSNIDNIVNHKYIADLFGAIFVAVKNVNETSDAE